MWCAAHAQLALAAAVHRHALALGPVVEPEQLAQRSYARGLDVDRLRAPRALLDVGDRVDRGVPGHAIAGGLEDRPRLIGHVGVLEPGVREPLHHHPVELRVRVHVHGRAAVEALQVERVHGARGAQLVHQLLGPGVRGVELEAGARVALEKREQPLGRLGPLLVGPERRMDTTKLTGRASRPERVGQRAARPGAAPGPAPPTRTPSAGRGSTARAPAATARAPARRAWRRTTRACTSLPAGATRPRPGRPRGRGRRRSRPRPRPPRRRRGGGSAWSPARTPASRGTRAPSARGPRSRREARG